MSKNKIYIRASMLPAWNDCPRRGAAQQYKKIIENAGYIINERPPSIGGIVGTSVHSGTAASLRKYISMQTYATVNDCVEIGMKSLKNEIGNGVIWDSTTTKMSDAETQTIQMIKSYCANISNCIVPKGIEIQRESIVYGDVMFSGKCDVDTNDSIRDTKTGVKIKQFHAQLGGYSLLRKAESGVDTKYLFIDFLQRVPIKKVYHGAKIIEYDVELCEELAICTIGQIAKAVRGFTKTGNSFYFPCNPMSVLCSDKYCTAYKTNFCNIYK